MEPVGSNRADIFEIYARFCDIVLRNERRSSREALSMLGKSLESRGLASDKVYEDLLTLMSHLNLSVDSHQFTCFYDFVFFICHENGQKNITVNKAITAWRLVLRGRFRLLGRWCDFVEKHQRHNISEDTWQQLLAFSRCVNENLEGYDPKGAWPILIDDFVEHMHRINQSRNCSTRDPCCNCDDMEQQLNISRSCGLKLLPASKRKSAGETSDNEEHSWENTRTNPRSNFKRLRQNSFVNKLGCHETYMADYEVVANAHDSCGCL